MFRKDVLLNVGGYSEEKSCILCEDYDLLLRLYAAGYHGYNLQECLLDYTVSATAKGNRKMSHRWNEVVTRFHRFRELGVLPAHSKNPPQDRLCGLNDPPTFSFYL